MPRTVLLYLLPAALVATGWSRLIDGVDERAVLALLALALAPALVRPWWGRAVAAVGSSFGAVWIVFAITPLALLPFDDRRFFGPLTSRFREGVLDFYDVSLPFPAGERPEMYDAVLLGIFAFALALALAIAARQPLAASVVLLSGSVWPATLVDGDDLARGALTLATVLVLLALGGRRPTRALKPAVLLTALLVAAAVGASTSAAVAKPEFLRWKGWDFYDKPADPVGVGYVWDATYRDLKWPEEETTVLKVRGAKRNLYWRATTLDTFISDRWIEDLAVNRVAQGTVDLTESGDLLIPRRAYDRSRWIRTRVQIEALRDRHLVGPAMPVAYDAREAGFLQISNDGVAAADDVLPRGTEYTVWSYTPSPKPEQLAKAGSPPEGLGRRYLEILPAWSLPVFGTPNRDALVRTLVRSNSAATPYEELYDRARDVVGNPRNAYAAVVSLEAWFRSEGGFVYDESPLPTKGKAPLLAFLRDQHGYCQHFAGAMTLMLRFLGIPSRVAVGFTSGELSKDGTTRTVTDHDAHAWVEVWFPGWGWLPFDPTPARGQLSGPYSYGGLGFDAAGASRVLRGSGGQTDRIRSKLTEARVGEQFQPDRPGGGGYVPVVREHGASLLKLLALLAAAYAVGIVLVKQAVRGRRYLTRDARRLAVACRKDLVDFLADQGVPLPRSATPRELARELESALSVDGVAFARALASARYATPRASRVASRRLRAELRALRRSLRRRLGVPRRLRGAVSLRSLAT